MSAISTVDKHVVFDMASELETPAYKLYDFAVIVNSHMTAGERMDPEMQSALGQLTGEMVALSRDVKEHFSRLHALGGGK